MCKASARMSTAEPSRPFAGPGVLAALWEAATTEEDKVIAAGAALSWAYLLRVGEASRLTCADLLEAVFHFCASKTSTALCERDWSARTRGWGLFVKEYAEARGLGGCQRVFPEGAAGLQRGMSRLLAGS